MPFFTNGHALIIGVGGDLPNTSTDAEGLAKILTDPERCAYPPHQVTRLTEEASHRQAILDELDALKQHTTVEDTVVVFFSGHGYQVTSDVGELYFLMPYGYDQSQLAKTCIRGDEFAAKLAAIPAQKLLVLLDCCHAGGVGESKEGGRTLTKAPLPPEALALLSQGRGKVLIASSTASELSYAGRPYSAFTLALLEALCGDGASKKDGYVRVADMALHTREKVPLRTNGRQHPILHFESADNFAVAYYAGGDVQPKGLPFPVESIEIESEPGRFRSGLTINTGGDFVGGSKITGTVGNVDQRAQVAIGQGISQVQQVAPSAADQTAIRLS